MPNFDFKPVPLLFLLGMAMTVGCAWQARRAYQPIIDTISHGSPDRMDDFVYGIQELTTTEKAAIRKALSPLRSPREELRLSIEEIAKRQGFTMVVLRVPWPRGSRQSDFHPLLFGQEDGRQKLIGYTQPFAPIKRRFSDQELEWMLDLSAWWIREYSKR